MALTDEQKKTFQAHLAKHIKKVPVCPICEGEDWLTEAIIAPHVLTEAEGGKPAFAGPGAYPLIAMMCRACCFVHHFVWLSIRKESDDGK